MFDAFSNPTPRTHAGPSRLRRLAAALVLLAGAGAGCKSAPAKPAAAGPPTVPDFIQAYVGQTRLLRGWDGERDVAVGKGASRTTPAACDVAVNLRNVALAKGTVRFALDVLGRPVSGRASKCPPLRAGLALVLTGFDPAGDPQPAQAALEQTLQTPEEYLKVLGVSFDYAPVASETQVACALPDANSDERSQGRKVTAWPKPVLSVEVAINDLTGKIRQEAEVTYEVVVGSDGRPRKPKVKTPLSEGHEKSVERVVALWRFEPARQGDKPVAARIELRTVLRIY